MDRITAAHVFVTIVERGSLASAAKTLDMSRAMVTRYLAEMEAWAGARLLHRSTRKLSLTAAGENTLTRCRRLLDAAQQMPADQDNAQAHGLLRIACSVSFAHDVLVNVLTDYQQHYPRMAIDLQTSSHSINLVEERIDLAIRITNQLDPSVIARKLAVCTSVVCASPAYLSSHSPIKQIEDLAMHNCLTYTYFGKSQWQFTHKETELTVPVSGNLSSNESTVLLKAAVDGVGIVMQPMYAASALIASGRLVAILPQYQPKVLDISAIYTSRQHQSAGLRTFLDYLAHWFSVNTHWEQMRPRSIIRSGH
jgi:DNA-binding transcriptional LysR family regulator